MVKLTVNQMVWLMDYPMAFLRLVYLLTDFQMDYRLEYPHSELQTDYRLGFPLTVNLMDYRSAFPLMELLMVSRKEFLQTVNHLENQMAFPRLVKLTGWLTVNRLVCLHSVNQMVSLMENLTEFLLRANPME